MCFSFSVCWEDSEYIHIVVFLIFFIDSTGIPIVSPKIDQFLSILFRKIGKISKN